MDQAVLIDGIMAIRCAELVAEYDRGYGNYVGPLGTIRADLKKTQYNSTTLADKVPVTPGAEIVQGQGGFELSPDADTQDFTDIKDMITYRGYGNPNNSGSLTLPERRDNMRFHKLGSAFNPANQYWTPVPRKPTHFDFMVIEEPDVKTLNVATGTIVKQFKGFTRANEEPMIQPGGNQFKLGFNYWYMRTWSDYTFNFELYGDGAGSYKAIVASTDYNPDTDLQIKIDTRVKLTLDGATGFGIITVKGLDYWGNHIEEDVTFAANGSLWTTNLFSRIYDDTDGDSIKGISVGTGFADATLYVGTDELKHTVE